MRLDSFSAFLFLFLYQVSLIMFLPKSLKQTKSGFPHRLFILILNFSFKPFFEYTRSLEHPISTIFIDSSLTVCNPPSQSSHAHNISNCDIFLLVYFYYWIGQNDAFFSVWVFFHEHPRSTGH